MRHISLYIFLCIYEIFVAAQQDVIYSHGTVHDNCTTVRYSEDPSIPVILECAGNLQIPSKNVRLNEIPQSVEGIFLGTKLSASIPPEKYTENNILSGNLPALPELPHLMTVALMQFNNDKRAPRLPFTKFLVNVLAKLKYLYIHNSKVLFLNAADFRGFASLAQLELKRCRISSISVDVFQELQYPLSVFEMGNSTLERFSVSGNSFETLDWRIFAPISATLRTIELDANPQLSRITMSDGEPYSLLGLRLLNITGSDNLKTLPNEVLMTLKDTEEMYDAPPILADVVVI